MEVMTLIMSAAKAVGVSGTLLLAICNHESGGFRQNYAPFDKGTPSYGSCQLKEDTALMFNFQGLPFELNDPKKNAKYSALYLKYQQDRYGEDWVKMTAAYNSGTFFESKRVPGCPRNLRYVNLVKAKLPLDLQGRLNCGISRDFAEAE